MIYYYILASADQIENPNFLESLLFALEKEEVTEDNIVQCVLEMFLAGTDTSSVSMYYTLVALSDDEAIEQKIANEAVRFMANENEIDRKQLNNLVELEKSLKESMRIKPVGPVVLRKALKDDVIAGVPIQSGTNIILNLAEMHRREDLFTNPESFYPDRFNEEKSDFYPFGTGPKGCIGQFLAMIEMKMIVGILLKKFKFTSAVGNLSKMSTRWDIANQPVNPSYMFISARENLE